MPDGAAPSFAVTLSDPGTLFTPETHGNAELSVKGRADSGLVADGGSGGGSVSSSSSSSTTSSSSDSDSDSESTSDEDEEDEDEEAQAMYAKLVRLAL